ncbi:uncharacterized protein [Macrobrachium rosenbergii]|uniref:uncharacterized protein n=1 Tax=Macrobrachium rosenbergii TaxID=79674 RepID=UPI0034D45BBD
MRLVKVLFASLLVLAECGYLHAYGVPGKAPPPPPPIVYQDKPTQIYQAPPPSIVHKDKPTQIYQAPPTTICADGQVLHVDGQCVTPLITRSIYLFNVPQQASKAAGPPPPVPLPKVDHNVIFVRVPEDQRGPDPIVVPPPQQKNIVYVLKKKTKLSGPKVIEVTAPPKTNPDVYFLGYDHGENPILPTGEDLASVLTQGGQEVQAKVVDSGVSGQAGSTGAVGPIKEVAGEVGSLPPLPVAGFGSQGGLGSAGESQGSTAGTASLGSGTIDKGSSTGGAVASTSAPVTQKTQVAPFSYYVPTYSKP